MSFSRPILFDCDGVLVNSEVIALQEERAALANLGLAYEPGEYVTRFMGLSDGDFWAALNQDSMARHARLLPPGLMKDIKAAIHARYESELHSIDGAAAFVSACAGPMAVASSSGAAILERKLVLAGLHAHFAPHIYSAELVARAKPAPDLFLFAAARLGVAIETCVVIEDSMHGVRAGVAAGAEVWGFTGGGYAEHTHAARLSEAGATRVFESFSAMQDFVVGLTRPA